MLKLRLALLFMLTCLIQGYSQDITLGSFEKDVSDLTARITAPVTDQNGEKCGINRNSWGLGIDFRYPVHKERNITHTS